MFASHRLSGRALAVESAAGKAGMAPHANADLRLAGNSSAATGTPVGEQRTRNRKETTWVLEAAVTNDGATRSIDMFHKMDGAKVENPRARVIVVKEFFDANGETLLGAVATIGGPRAHLDCLQLMCDISSCAQLSSPMQADLERLHQLLANARTVGAAHNDETDRSCEEVGLMADRLAELLEEIGPKRRKVDLSEWLVRRA